jgi:hypothetical protein
MKASHAEQQPQLTLVENGAVKIVRMISVGYLDERKDQR